MPAAHRSLQPSPYSLLTGACQRDSARPRLTWYDNRTGQRAELSGATLLNWVNKTANFMIDELLVAPGVSITLQLPRHWLTATWWLAAHAVGAHPLIGSPDSLDSLDEGTSAQPAVAVFGPQTIASQSIPAGAEHLVAVALSAMGGGFAASSPQPDAVLGDDLPPGTYDFEREVRNQPDAFRPAEEGGRDVATAALSRASSWSLTPADRLIAGGALTSEDDLVSDLLAPLAADASCIWIQHADPTRDVEHAVAERATVTTMSQMDLPTRRPIRYLT